MALHIADYKVIRYEDGRWADFRLPDDERRDTWEAFLFAMPSHAVVAETAVLSYMLDPVPFGGEVDIEYDIRINDERIARHRIESTMLRSLTALVKGDLLLAQPAIEDPPPNNRIEFRMIQRRSNGGYLRVFNAVLWFQRSVAAP